MVRRRKYTISIQMTFTSWTLEAISGIFVLVITLFFAYDASLEIATQVFIAIHVFLCFIVIPGSYLLNTEVFKNRIVEQGWSEAIPRNPRNRRVAPLMKEEAERTENTQRNNPSNKNIPIPTISGNVNIETSYKVY